MLSDDEIIDLKFAIPKIYPITDSNLSGLSHAAQVREFIAGGARLVQIRDKLAPSAQLYDDILQAVQLARNSDVKIVINDRADLALMTGADGVHLGQDDIAIDAARRLLGDKAIVGISTHSPEQALAAIESGGCDYVAFGPVFSTSTKLDHEPVVGLEMLKMIRKIVTDVPLVAIGGIKEGNLASVFENGADSAATISAFYGSREGISLRFRQLSEIADR